MQLDGYLKKIGYNPEKIPKVPISGWTGDNLFEPVRTVLPRLPLPSRAEAGAGAQVDAGHPLKKWYNGPCLLQALDAVDPPKRPTEKPLRLPLQATPAPMIAARFWGAGGGRRV